MNIRNIVEPANEATEEIIRKEINEDPERLKRQIELFNEWLRCESHLPDEVGKKTIFSFFLFRKNKVKFTKFQ